MTAKTVAAGVGVGVAVLAGTVAVGVGVGVAVTGDTGAMGVGGGGGGIEGEAVGRGGLKDTAGGGE